jgi:hypothetical protein
LPGGDTQARLDVFHQQKKVEGIGRGGLEPEALIKRFGPFVLGVDHDGPTADEVRRLHGPQQRIP